jgi:hypothetical protein
MKRVSKCKHPFCVCFGDVWHWLVWKGKDDDFGLVAYWWHVLPTGSWPSTTNPVCSCWDIWNLHINRMNQKGTFPLSHLGFWLFCCSVGYYKKYCDNRGSLFLCLFFIITIQGFYHSLLTEAFIIPQRNEPVHIKATAIFIDLREDSPSSQNPYWWD